MKLKNINKPIEHKPGEPMTALSGRLLDERIAKHLPQVTIENLDPRARLHKAYRLTFPEGTTYRFVPSMHGGERPDHAYTLPTGEDLYLSNYWDDDPYVWWSNWDQYEPFKSEQPTIGHSTTVFYPDGSKMRIVGC